MVHVTGRRKGRSFFSRRRLAVEWGGGGGAAVFLCFFFFGGEEELERAGRASEFGEHLVCIWMCGSHRLSCLLFFFLAKKRVVRY